MTTVYICNASTTSSMDGIRKVLFTDEDDLVYQHKDNEFDVITHILMKMYIEKQTKYVLTPISVAKLELDDSDIDIICGFFVRYDIDSAYLPEET